MEAGSVLAIKYFFHRSISSGAHGQSTGGWQIQGAVISSGEILKNL